MSKYNYHDKAVALRYDKEHNRAPVIVASGCGYVAEKMVEVALDHGVPIYEDTSLTSLLTKLELGQEIPEELYQAIVDIYLYFLQYGKDQSTPLSSPKND